MLPTSMLFQGLGAVNAALGGDGGLAVARNRKTVSDTLGSVLMGLRGRVEKVGNTVLFLASGEASYMTGAELGAG